MHITVKLFATFRTGRFKEAQKEYPEGTVCASIIAELGLSEGEIGIIMVNGRHGAPDQALRQGDTLSLFPLVGGG